MSSKLLVGILIVGLALVGQADAAYAQPEPERIPPHVRQTSAPPDLTLDEDDFSILDPWQDYVRPREVLELAQQVRSIQGAYLKAVSWPWVSDQTLHGVDEKWLYPREFLTGTPGYASNPDTPPKRAVSDCEEQACTLVSLLIAVGVSPENVRVAVGKVRFGEQEGGHAWAEIYEDNTWMALEATSGPYWDGSQMVERGGFPYNYYRTNSYPAIEVWAYFNNRYFYNVKTGENNAPSHWWTGGYYGPDDGVWVPLGLMLLTSAIGVIAAIVISSFKGQKIKML